MSVTCSQNWYVKRSVPAGVIQLVGMQPAGTAVYDFSITANNSYSPRDITVVFSTDDDLYEYEVTVTQEGVQPYFYFLNSALDDYFEYEFTGVAASTVQVGFDLNFPWRFSETGMNSLLSATSHQPGTVYPVANMSAGKQETMTFTSIDYTNRTGMPAAGTTLVSTASIYNVNTDPYPVALQGTIQFTREVPSVFDLVNTSIAPLVDTIPRTGGTITLTAGSNDDWSMLATNGLTVPTVTKGAVYEINTLSVVIPPTEEIRTSRIDVLDIDVYYQWNGQQEKTATYRQKPYHLIPLALFSDFFSSKNLFSLNLYGLGDIAIQKFSGDYPALSWRLTSEDIPVGSIHTIPAGTLDSVLFVVPENTTGKTKIFRTQYSADGINWTYFSSITQYPNNVYYSSNFYAKENATENNSQLMT